MNKPLQQIVAEINATDGETIWDKRVAYLRPKNVLELGTGQGATAKIIATSLPFNALFTTVNYDYPSFGEFGEQLNDCRYFECLLKRVCGDTLDPDTLTKVPGRVDLMFLDTHHEAWQAGAELELWQSKLVHGAIVIVDDLGVCDMMVFWDSVPYEKVTQDLGAVQGYFRYDQSNPYKNTFPRGRTPKELAKEAT